MLLHGHSTAYKLWSLCRRYSRDFVTVRCADHLIPYSILQHFRIFFDNLLLEVFANFLKSTLNRYSFTARNMKSDVRVVHLADVKLGDLATSKDWRTFCLVDWSGIAIRYYVPQCPLKNGIGGDLISLAI